MVVIISKYKETKQPYLSQALWVNTRTIKPHSSFRFPLKKKHTKKRGFFHLSSAKKVRSWLKFPPNKAIPSPKTQPHIISCSEAQLWYLDVYERWAISRCWPTPLLAVLLANCSQESETRLSTTSHCSLLLLLLLRCRPQPCTNRRSSRGRLRIRRVKWVRLKNRRRSSPCSFLQLELQRGPRAIPRRLRKFLARLTRCSDSRPKEPR